ncbi:Bone morphogenetic protein 2, partial [Armadillidium nasatum]
MITFCICLYIAIIGGFYAISANSANPSLLDPFENLISSQLFKDIKRPRHVRRATFTEPPQYMLDLYNEVANSEGLTKSPLPHGASLVRAIPVKVENDNELTFALDIIPDEESIIEGELQIHHHLSSEQREKIGKENFLKINLFTNSEDDEKRFLASNIVGSHFGGWRSFSVGDVVKEERWKYGRISFVVEIETMEGKPIEVINHHSHRSSTKPVLVLFNGVSNSSSIPLVLHELAMEKGNTRVKRGARSIEATFKASMTSISGCVPSTSLQYDAYQCLGRCSFPLSLDYNPTNHATLESLVHQRSDNKDGIAYPSCVPTTYKSLSLLYYDKQDT